MSTPLVPLPSYPDGRTLEEWAVWCRCMSASQPLLAHHVARQVFGAPEADPAFERWHAPLVPVRRTS